MYCDPYAFLSREEHRQKIWAEQLTPNLQAMAYEAYEMVQDRGLALMEL